MPSIALYPPTSSSRNGQNNVENPLPSLLQTPSGLAILEIQGTIHAPLSAPTAERGTSHPPVSVGKLVFPNPPNPNCPDDLSWMKRVYLYVGKHQRMAGEVKKLVNPLAVIRKRNDVNFSTEDQLEIVEIVKYKVQFSQRPEPVGGD